MNGQRRPFADDLPAVLPIITTEHFNLQTVRASTTAEAVGRASMYLATVSTALVALSFAGQATQFSQAFVIFGTVTFASLFLLGVMTFDRTLQVSIEDHQAARRMNRLRQLYLELAPGLGDYLAPPAADNETATVLSATGIKANSIQLLLTVAGMVSVINSVVVGVVAGALMLRIFPDHNWSAAALGFAAFATSLAVHQRFQRIRRKNSPSPLPTPVSTAAALGEAG